VTAPLRLSHRFLLAAFLVASFSAAVAGLISYLQYADLSRERTFATLRTQARFLADASLPFLERAGKGKAAAGELHRLALEGDRLGRGLGVRFTVVLPDGTPVADSAVGASRIAGMENHGDRPEVAAALAGREGRSVRRSVTEGSEEVYAAVPVRSGKGVLGAARASVRLSSLASEASRLRTIVLGSALAALLSALVLSVLLGRRLAKALSALGRAASDFSLGRTDRRIPPGGVAELDEVAEAMNRMADRVRSTVAELEEGKARLSTLLDSLDEGALVIGEGKTVRMANREARRILDAPEALVEGRPYTEAVRHPSFLDFLDRARQEGGTEPRDLSLPSSGESRDVRVAAVPVRFAGEERAELLVTLRDVTEERRLARIKSDFASNASHELRTPLTNVRGYLEAMADARRDGEEPEPFFLDVALQNTMRMERIIDDLLELARAESSRVSLDREELVPRAFLAEVAALYAAEAEKLSKRIVVEGGEDPFPADRRKMTLAVGNLVENALRYGKAGGTVTLSGRRDGNHALLVVEDDGPGIAREHLPRLFERFYRADRGRSREKGGTGLGLSIVKHLVESHGGTVAVESAIGRGTTFSIRLPLR
jgi:two-component system phosphate regulon sensor histidine kinase PhoR